jgi:hypothetical protein
VAQDGERKSRFEPFLNRLPNHRLTLYDLAVLQADQFDRVTKDERFGPTITGKQVREIVGRKSSTHVRGKANEGKPNECVEHVPGWNIYGLDESTKPNFRRQLTVLVVPFPTDT